MKNTGKILGLGIILILLLALIMPTKVMAYSFNFNATADKTTAKEGETVTITLGLSNIDAGDAGINTVETQILYDSSIFEEITQDNIQSNNRWSLTYNGENNGGKILGVILSSGVKENQNSIGTITLKVRPNVEYKETRILFSDIATNNGNELISDTDKEVKLTVGTYTPQTPNNEEGTKQPAASNNEPTTNDNTKNTTGAKKDTTTASTSIPKTGIGQVFGIIAIIALVFCAIFFAHKANKTKQV